MSDWKAFPYQAVGGNAMPLLPIILAHGEVSVRTHGLVDSGAAVNVIPFSVGLSLGLRWEDERPVVHLGGMLSGRRAKAVVLTGRVPGFDEGNLAFAWCESDDVRVIFGQMNFFRTFDVQFRLADMCFDLRQRNRE